MRAAVALAKFPHLTPAALEIATFAVMTSSLRADFPDRIHMRERFRMRCSISAGAKVVPQGAD